MTDDKNKKLSPLTYLSYGLAYGSGFQIMHGIVGSYLMVFLTDTFGVPAAAVGAIMLLASVWDAINDPLMGVLADKTKTRFGRYRPYLLIVPFLLAVVDVCLFLSPNLSNHGKIVWTAVFYVLYGMLRTAFEIPCNALINAITNKENERQKLISTYTFTMGIFTTITTSFALTFVTLFGGENTAKGYVIVMAIAGLCTIASSLACFFATKERFVAPVANHALIEQLKKLVHVKGLVVAVVIWLAGYVGYNIMMASSVYYVLYCLCRPDLISLYMLTISICGLLGISIFIPVFMRIFGSVKRCFAVSQVGTFVCNALCIFLGSSVPAIFVFSGLGCLFATMFMVFGAMFMTEMADAAYAETGIMMNGTIAALKGFTNKCGMALSNGIIGGTLAATGYIANAIGHEPIETIRGITAVRFAIPAVMALVIVIAIRFYPITEEMKKAFRAKAAAAGEGSAGGFEKEAVNASC